MVRTAFLSDFPHIHSLQTPHSFSVSLSCFSITPFPPRRGSFCSVVRIRCQNWALGYIGVIVRLILSRVEEQSKQRKQYLQPCLLKVLTLFISLLIGSVLHSANGSFLLTQAQHHRCHLFANLGSALLIGLCFCLKGIVHPKITILSSFTHPLVVPNLYEFICSAEHKGRYSEESL